MTGLGGMRERPNRMVSKTIVAQVTVGSNPTPSATQSRSEARRISQPPNEEGYEPSECKPVCKRFPDRAASMASAASSALDREVVLAHLEGVHPHERDPD